MKGFVGALAVTGSFLLIADAAGQAGPRDELKGWLRELVLEAKASGRSQIEIPAPQITPPFVDNLFTVGERYTVIGWTADADCHVRCSQMEGNYNLVQSQGQ